MTKVADLARRGAGDATGYSGPRCITMVIDHHDYLPIKADCSRQDHGTGRSSQELGLRPGSVLEWDQRDDEVIVRRAGRYSSADIHAAIFPNGVPRLKTGKELKEGIRQLTRKRHARD